jgi:hypothetical protein
MQSGELIVVGTSSLSIPLVKMPDQVKAYFKGDLELVPCNPHYADSLQYSVHTTNNSHTYKFALVIEWSVSGAREIKWEVDY